MARGLNVSFVMTCLLKKQAEQGMLNLYLAWTGQPTKKNFKKKHYPVGALSVERPMLPKWK